MSEHRDAVVGSVTDYGGATLEVAVRGVDVVLTLAHDGETASIALSPDEAAVLAQLLEKALAVE